ncbi:MAG: hypothetical protein AAF514_23880 [Verrucomicrobiota bacterium]
MIVPHLQNLRKPLVGLAGALAFSLTGAQEPAENPVVEVAENEFEEAIAPESVPAEGEETSVPVPNATESGHAELLLVVGAAGEEKYLQDFGGVAERWAEAAKKGDVKSEIIAGERPAEALKTFLTETTAKKSDTPLWIVYIGHGTFNGREAKWNLSGPDVSSFQLKEWLTPFERTVFIVSGSSASGPFVRDLSAPNRVVITATESGSEWNYALFGNWFSKALNVAEADLNNDGQNSLFENFLYAARQTESFYKEEGRLATEHALLDDNGDTRGTSAEAFDPTGQPAKKSKEGSKLDGELAQLWSLILNAQEKALSAQQRQQRNLLEQQIFELRRRRSALTEEQFYTNVEILLRKVTKIYDEALGDGEKEAVTNEKAIPEPAVDVEPEEEEVEKETDATEEKPDDGFEPSGTQG